MQGPCETGETFGVCTSLYKNWKCRTSTKGTKVPPGHPPLPLYHPPVRNEELRLSLLLAHSSPNGEKRLVRACASCLPCSFFPRTPCGHGAQVIVEGREEKTDGGHLACRALLSVSLSPILVTGSPALSGLVSFLPCDDWHLSTAPSIAWTGYPVCQGHWSLAMCSLFSFACP